MRVLLELLSCASDITGAARGPKGPNLHKPNCGYLRRIKELEVLAKRTTCRALDASHKVYNKLYDNSTVEYFLLLRLSQISYVHNLVILQV